MKILFIDHAFHKKTRSSQFFADIVETRHKVDWLFIDPTDREAMSKLDIVSQYDLAIVWQMDFLAPLVLARGIRTVVIPMFDGSSLMPDLHWLISSQARYINFSRRLHDRVGHLECESKLVKYFKPAVRKAERARFDSGLHVLLWQRRPEQGINLGMVERLFGSQLTSLHVHDAADDPEVNTAPYLQRTLDSYKLTVSNWFESRNEFDRLLSQHNVLIAPRRAEGIGMAMLEGMARGMVVAAADAPTHDEYIANWMNGVLFNPDTVAFTDFSTAQQVGEMAWITAQDGHKRWLESQFDILDYIEQTPLPRIEGAVKPSEFERQLIRSYMGGLESYHNFLMSHLALVEDLSRISLVGRIDKSGKLTAGIKPAARNPFNSARELPWLEQNRMDAEAAASGRYLLQGTMVLRQSLAWMVGERATFGFRIDPRLGVTSRLKIHYTLPPGTEAGVGHYLGINGHTLQIGSITKLSGIIECDIPVNAVRHENELTISLASSRFAHGGEEPVSLGIKRLELI